MVHLAILGGGPIGVELALATIRKGFNVDLFEIGSNLGSNVLSWGHVKLFSPNSMNNSVLGLSVLKELGVKVPDQSYYPSGLEFVQGYLSHIGYYLEREDKCQIHLNTEVVSVGRGRLLKGNMGPQRKNEGFRLLVRKNTSGEEMFCGYDVVVDCTGTYGHNNWMGIGGIPCIGEQSLQDRISYTLKSHAEKTDGVTLVVGSGASAVTCLAQLQSVGADVVWATRTKSGNLPYQLVEGDSLPQRDALYRLGNKLAGGYIGRFNSFQYFQDCSVLCLKGNITGKLTVTLEVGEEKEVKEVLVDKIMALVGYRPNLRISQELQVDYCYASEGPMRQAAALLASGGGGGDCLTQVTPGPETLRTKEQGFYILGMKSYGRGSAFLLRVGHEQIDNLLQILDGTT